MRILALVHRHLIPPVSVDAGTDITSEPWRTEYDVISTLTAMGHEVQALGVHDDLGEIRRLATEWKPHIAFNLLEGFDDITVFDQNVVSHLELLKLAYTGCNPRGMLLARDKWSGKYQKKCGIDSGPARELADPKSEQLQHLCKRAYRALELSGYARIDLRLDEAGNPWVIEANPNPQIARGEDFAASAEKAGLSYETVLQRILNLGLRWQPASVA